MIQINKSIPENQGSSIFFKIVCAGVFLSDTILLVGILGQQERNMLVPIYIRKDNPSLRGDRIKSARMLAGYTRKGFADRFKIPVATVRAWEEPPVNRNGVTTTGVKRLIKVFHESGIYCTPDWLLHGRGPGPTMVDRYRETEADDKISWGEEESILRDIESFKQNNPAPMVTVVTDNSMLPFYGYGDYVGGGKKIGPEIRSLVGLNCVVETRGRVLIRRISLINEFNRYTLTALSMDQAGEEPVILDAEITAAAQIVWHRSRERVSVRQRT